MLERISNNPVATRSTLHGLPWFTPIVGSGCLHLGKGPSLDSDALRELVQKQVALMGLGEVKDFPAPAAMAVDFAGRLMKANTHELPNDEVRSNGGEADYRAVPTEGAARVTLLTALLTRLYHLAASHAIKPMSRLWMSDHVVFASRDPREKALLKMALTILRSILESPIGGPYSDAVSLLLRRIDTDLSHIDDQKLAVLDLRMLTELTWILLISGTSIYPGWSDLLLELLLELTEEEGSWQHYRPRIQELWALDDNLARLLIRPTILSWEGRQKPGDADPRESFYSAVADLLRSQAELHLLLHPEDTGSDDDEDFERLMEQLQEVVRIKKLITEDVNHKRTQAAKDKRPSPPEPSHLAFPHPAAYVTSFDLELEAALWHQGKPFRVVMPVFSASQSENTADLVWITALIDPDGDRNLPLLPDYDRRTSGSLLAASEEEGWPSIKASSDLHTLRAAAREWRVAEKAIAATGEESGGWCPIVVRVTGSPLMVLPAVEGNLFDDFEQHLHVAVGGRRKLKHALAIDEYTSVRQAEHELFFAARNQRRGLPIVLSTGAGSTQRVWVGFGVQVDDPAIRLRMFSQLSAASITRRVDDYNMKAGDSDSASVKGLAVNRRIDEDQSTALQWLGFEFVVQSSAAELVPDVQHCAAHYRHIKQEVEELARAEVPIGDLYWGRAMEKRCDLWNPTGKTR